jgi:hypothetical protein
MLLGQVVAISFATNLFLLAVILNPSHPFAPKPSNSKAKKHRNSVGHLGPWLPNALPVLAIVGSLSGLLLENPVFHRPSWFMPLLLIPHITLLILPILHAVIPQKSEYTNDVQDVYDTWPNAVLGGGGLVFIKTTVEALVAVGPGGIARALYEHPAVSSVGWDVIFCWVTWICWMRIQGDEKLNVPTKKSENDGASGR